MSIFVIINEWTGSAGASASEVVGGKYFESENGARDALSLIAEAYDTHLEPDETSLQFEDPKPHLRYEEYYIQELMPAS